MELNYSISPLNTVFYYSATALPPPRSTRRIYCTEKVTSVQEDGVCGRVASSAPPRGQAAEDSRLIGERPPQRKKVFSSQFEFAALLPRSRFDKTACSCTTL